jgi:hypothetical protein
MRRHYARHGDSIAPPVVWTLLHIRGLGARSFRLCLREASRSARNLTKRASYTAIVFSRRSISRWVISIHGSAPMRSPSRIWPDLSGSRLFRRSARSCSISRIYSSQVVTRASAGAGCVPHYAARQSIRPDRSRNGPKNAQSANPNNGYGNSNIACATEAPSAIRAPTGGAIPGRNRGGRRVSVSSSNAEPRGRSTSAIINSSHSRGRERHV